MCLIIKADKPQLITETMMNCAYLNNDDGFGVMFANKGKVHVQKIGKPKSFKSIQKVWDSYKDLDIPVGVHFRFTTNGESNKAMSHPFKVLSKDEHTRDIWLMHNGPQLPTPMIDDGKSDTHQFVKWVLRPQLANEPELLYNPDWQEMIGDMIGSDKLLFLDSKTEEFTIINEQEGKTTDDMWLSNTYSLQPTGNYALTRDYKYNADTDTMEKNESKYYGYDWDYEDEDMSGWRGHYSGVGKTTVTRDGRRIHEKPVDVKDVQENGQSIDTDDWYGMTQEEVYDTVCENPMGTAEWVYDVIYNGNKESEE